MPARLQSVARVMSPSLRSSMPGTMVTPPPSRALMADALTMKASASALTRSITPWSMVSTSS